MRLASTICVLFLVGVFAVLINTSIITVSLELEDIVITSNFTYWITIFVLFVLLLILNKSANNSSNESQFVKLYQIFLLVTYFLTFSISFFKPLSSRIIYLQMFIPLIAFSSTRVYMQGQKNDKVLSIAFMALFLFIIWGYYQSYQVLALFSTARQSLRNSASYEILLLLPILLCYKNRYIRIICISVVFIIMVTSFKRGCFVAFVVGLMSYFICYYRTKGKSIKIQYIIAGIILLAILTYSTEYLNNSLGGKFLERFEESNDFEDRGGRTSIFFHTVDMITDSDIIGFIFGHGFNSVVSDSSLGLSAHNDFLESFYDYGLIGFCLYCGIYIFLIKQIRYMTRQLSFYAAPLACSLGIVVVSSLVSHIIKYPLRLLELTVVWGCIIGLYNKSIIRNYTN